jgi:DSBA-like thioredoxin domain-containing protein
VHKFYPLHFHTRAEPAARAAIAALDQGRYWEMERALFDHQGEQTDVDFDRYAKELGLDLARFHEDMRADRTTKILERDRADADRAGLTGTPFILINGREFDLNYFHPDVDLEPWVALELELVQGRQAVAASLSPDAIKEPPDAVTEPRVTTPPTAPPPTTAPIPTSPARPPSP